MSEMLLSGCASFGTFFLEVKGCISGGDFADIRIIDTCVARTEKVRGAGSSASGVAKIG